MSALLLAALLAPHPIHVSSATLVWEPGARSAQLQVRTFADDFPAGPDSARALRYLADRFVVTDGTGRRLALTLRTLKRDGAALVLALSLAAPDGLAGGRVWHGVLMERFSDQVNLLRVRIGGRSTSLIFSLGDGPKPLP